MALGVLCAVEWRYDATPVPEVEVLSHADSVDLPGNRLSSACGFVGFPGVYKINVEQGNIVTQEMVDQLKPGMNRRQVRFILGTPLIEDTFNQNRWDYLYVKRNGMKVSRQIPTDGRV